MRVLVTGAVGTFVVEGLTTPDPGFAVLYGTSANTRGWWDLEPGRALGYEPQDDAETFADRIEARPEVLATCQEMYRRWPFWRTLIDNAQMILSKADLTIARLYADTRVNRIYGGTSEVMKSIIAKDLGLAP